MNKLHHLITLLIFLFISLFAGGMFGQKTTRYVSQSFQGKITAIKDGDTFKIFSNGYERTVRLAHIDCPEKKQAFGTRAKWFASQLCYGKTVTVNAQKKPDRYQRIIGEIILSDGTNVNKELVKNGLAWHFKKYSKSKEYAYLEREAREKRVGLWSEEAPVAPWDFRKFKRKPFY